MITQNFSRVLLGKLKDDSPVGIAAGENVWLEKHKWDCGWYWGFGYVGNLRCHFHFEALLYPKDANNTVQYLASELFEKTCITDDEWWVIRDLFVQAYALKGAAEVYRHGGHQTTNAGLTGIIKNTERAAQINADLQKVLDAAWDYTYKAAEK